MWTRRMASRESLPWHQCITKSPVFPLIRPALGLSRPNSPLFTCRCCTSCGQVLDETTFSAEVTFTKGAGGISTADGQFVSDVAASRGLGRISGGRLYGYQVSPPSGLLCQVACCLLAQSNYSKMESSTSRLNDSVHPAAGLS